MNYDYLSEIKVRHYAVTLARGAVKVGLCLEFSRPIDPVTGERLDRSPTWKAFRDGHVEDVFDCIIEFDPDGEPVVKGERITEAEYEYLLQDRAWARQHSPDAPEANPRKRVDLNAMPVLF